MATVDRESQLDQYFQPLTELVALAREERTLGRQYPWALLEASDRAIQTLRATIYAALRIRHQIYYTAEPNSDIEKWANELGGILGKGAPVGGAEGDE